MPFNEYSAPLTLGARCAGLLPTICGASDHAYPVSISLADQDDVASVNSFTDALTMDAGPGDDDVLAGGISATANGGTGSDSIVLAANGLTTGNGGDGRDRVYGGLGAAAAVLTGGRNGDLLVPDGFDFNSAKGGSGPDRLVAFTGSTVNLSGDGGSDILAVPTGRGRITLDGGSGTDTIVSHVGGVTVDAGSGADVVDVRGDASSAPDTVSCGSGFDLAWANSADSVADDCEIVIRRGTPPVVGKVTAAIDAAHTLAAHRPDPSGV
jgi:Ca2+-binding RTX toxin-like protein